LEEAGRFISGGKEALTSQKVPRIRMLVLLTRNVAGQVSMKRKTATIFYGLLAACFYE
jgi:hypothetical protein